MSKPQFWKSQTNDKSGLLRLVSTASKGTLGTRPKFHAPNTRSKDKGKNRFYKVVI